MYVNDQTDFSHCGKRNTIAKDGKDCQYPTVVNAADRVQLRKALQLNRPIEAVHHRE